MQTITIHIHQDAGRVIGKFEGIDEIREHASIPFLIYDLIFEYCPICSERLTWCRNNDLIFESYRDPETGLETTRVSLRGTFAEGTGATIQEAFFDLISNNALDCGIKILIHRPCDHEITEQ